MVRGRRGRGEGDGRAEENEKGKDADGPGVADPGLDLEENDGEEHAADVSARRDAAHGQRALGREVEADKGQAWDVDQPAADAEADALREHDLVALGREAKYEHAEDGQEAAQRHEVA